MGALTVLLLGLIQGAAEFLPISSSGHLALFEDFFPVFTGLEGMTALNVLLHLGTLAAVCIYYRKDLTELIRAIIRLPRGQCAGESKGRERTAILLALGTLPLVLLKIADLIFHKAWGFDLTGLIDRHIARQPIAVGAILVINGLMLLVSDRIDGAERALDRLPLRRGLFIGIFQMFALLPGLSRSGSAFTAGRLCGLSRGEALRFSFLLSVPAVAGSLLFEAPKAVSGAAGQALGTGACAAAVILAFAVGIGCLGLLGRMAKRSDMKIFSVYCFAAGSAAILAGIWRMSG